MYLMEAMNWNVSQIRCNIRKGVSIYRQFEENPEIFLYVPNPALKAEVWRDFEP